ncbi:MAG: hypothetical protein AAFP87_20460 [Pseudomonadota bacterium]
MCFGTPDIQTEPVRRMAAPASDAMQREGEVERSLRRRRSGVAADILTAPLGVTQ